MGQDIIAQVLVNKKLSFIGGYEYKSHPMINKKICDICIKVPSTNMLTIESFHLMLCHVITSCIRETGKEVKPVIVERYCLA